MKHFGFDLDNTLIDYSESCRQYAKKYGLPNISTINELKRLLKTENKQDATWTLAQSWIYGAGLQYAFVSDSAIKLLDRLSKNGWKLSIHSHKTEFGPEDYGSVPFRELMFIWLKSSKLRDFFAIESNIYFYESVDSKVAGIAKSDLDCYMDDLPKIFKHKNYPRHVRSFLYRNQDIDLEWTIKISNFEDILL